MTIVEHYSSWPLTNPKTRDMLDFIKPKKHVYLLRARWRATALDLRITAKDEDEAMMKAEKQVIRMEGGTRCSEIIFIRQLE